MLINNDKIHVNAQKCDGCTVLHVAATCYTGRENQKHDGVCECVKMLVKRKDFNSLDTKSNYNITASQVTTLTYAKFSAMIAFWKEFNKS